MHIWQHAAGRFDVAVVRLAQMLAPRPSLDGEALARRMARLEQTARAYQRVSPADFFRAPPPLRPHKAAFVRDLPGGGEAVDLCWVSGWQPHDEAGRADYLAFEENRIAHARL